jgi:hypothetical protein
MAVTVATEQSSAAVGGPIIGIREFSLNSPPLLSFGDS